MRMRELPALELPSGKAVKLAPGGMHLMLIDLKAPLKVGDKVPLKLRFEKAGEIEVLLNVEVKPAATLACPIVSVLDQWMAQSVQPAAQRWFGQPVVAIKQKTGGS